jgi:hypothetical protein
MDRDISAADAGQSIERRAIDRQVAAGDRGAAVEDRRAFDSGQGIEQPDAAPVYIAFADERPRDMVWPRRVVFPYAPGQAESARAAVEYLENRRQEEAIRRELRDMLGNASDARAWLHELSGEDRQIAGMNDLRAAIGWLEWAVSSRGKGMAMDAIIKSQGGRPHPEILRAWSNHRLATADVVENLRQTAAETPPADRPAEIKEVRAADAAKHNDDAEPVDGCPGQDESGPQPPPFDALSAAINCEREFSREADAELLLALKAAEIAAGMQVEFLATHGASEAPRGDVRLAILNAIVRAMGDESRRELEAHEIRTLALAGMGLCREIAESLSGKHRDGE